jgi:hypothetical protein
MKFEKVFEAFAAFLETLSVAITAANSINPVVNFFRCVMNWKARNGAEVISRNFRVTYCGLETLKNWLWPHSAQNF